MRIPIFATFLTAGLLMLSSCSNPTSCHGLMLEKVWELDGFNNPESVAYDPQTQALYVSNVAGDGKTKDGVGSIAKVSLEGELLDLNWALGLNAPKGVDITHGKLYTADIDTLVEIDLANGEITAQYPVADAEFLNDVAAGPDGTIYVSDMAKNRIHTLKEGQFTLWLESENLQNPNGLFVEGDHLVVGAWGVSDENFNTEIPGHLKAVDLDEKAIADIGDGSPVGNMDGIEPLDTKGYLVTDWKVGKLFHITSSGQVQELLSLEQGMADLEYIPSQRLVVLPMMNTNQLIAYRISQ